MHLNVLRISTGRLTTQLILLFIEDVIEREYYKRHLEKIVETGTAELVLARQEAEKRKCGLSFGSGCARLKIVSKL